jgi:death-on-curing protein
VYYPTKDDVLDLHDDALAAFGGDSGVMDEGAIESALARPKTSFGGHERFPDVPSKAAALLHGLVMAHAFVDGNKRTAAAVALTFVKRNEHLLQATGEKIESITREAGAGERDVDELTEWFDDHTRPIDDE